MYTHLFAAFLLRPLVSAAPFNLLGGVTGAVEGLPSTVGGLVGGVVGTILPTTIQSESLLKTTVGNIRKQVTEVDQLFETFAGLFQAVKEEQVPDSIPDALASVATLLSKPTLENIAQSILNGLSVPDLTQNVLAAYLGEANSFDNDNPPVQNIYPKSPQDAPYSVSEAQLRAAIYIPPGFTYGQKRPVLFVPGTGAFGGVNFLPNLGKLLSPDYDTVYLNIPGAQYNDTQVNSEYVAYAINYVSTITSGSSNANNLAVIPWSQGNPDTQWAFQYWPSTRGAVTDFISISADFHGTTLAYFLDPAFPGDVPLPPSVIQQEYDSNFIRALRGGGGGSPYVPSTSIWSIDDEIVQPQYDPVASAAYFTQDLPGSPTCPSPARDIPYTNNQIQMICQGRPAGGVYLHEGVLFNPLAYALVLDALQNDGPGQVSRLNLDIVCAQAVAPGLSLEDVLATEGLIPLAALNLLLYPQKVTEEPAVLAYAAQYSNCGGQSGGGHSWR
jgi:hypothetical protein